MGQETEPFSKVQTCNSCMVGLVSHSLTLTVMCMIISQGRLPHFFHFISAYAYINHESTSLSTDHTLKASSVALDLLLMAAGHSG